MVHLFSIIIIIIIMIIRNVNLYGAITWSIDFKGAGAMHSL